MQAVSFTRMADGSYDEYQFLAGLERQQVEGTAARVLTELARQSDWPAGYQIDRLGHSLQTATRAMRDGAGEEMVVAALLHDIGDGLAPSNHGDFAAAVLAPYVSEPTCWVIRHHGIFQGYYYFHHIGADRNLRERYRGHPQFEACAEFCEKWDQISFDPDYDTMPLDAFRPMVERIFAREPFAAERE